MVASEIVKSILLANKDKFFTVEFVKVDGTVRKLNGRFNVHGVPPVTVDGRALLAYDVKIKGFRRVTLDKVKEIRMKHGSLTIA